MSVSLFKYLFISTLCYSRYNRSNKLKYYTDFKHSGMSSLDDGISSLIKILPLLLPREYTSGLIHLENGREGGNIISKLCRSQRRLCGGKRGRPALAVAGN